MAKRLPPDPEQQNRDRASWAQAAVTKFQQQTGADNCDAVSDLLANLMHLCDEKNVSGENAETFAVALRRAKSHYKEETTS